MFSRIKIFTYHFPFPWDFHKEHRKEPGFVCALHNTQQTVSVSHHARPSSAGFVPPRKLGCHAAQWTASQTGLFFPPSAKPQRRPILEELEGEIFQMIFSLGFGQGIKGIPVFLLATPNFTNWA